MTSTSDVRRLMLRNAARGLINDARAERASLPADAGERQFYLGVDAAAEEVLQPGLADTRPADWLDRETPSFREGYLQTSILLATVSTSDDPPSHVPLPPADGAG